MTVYELIQIDEEKLKTIDTSEFKIESVEIENNDQYEKLCELLKKVKGKSKEIENFFKEPKAKAYENHKSISKLEKEMLEKLSEFEKTAKKSISDYLIQLESNNTASNPVDRPKVKGVSASDTYKWEVVDRNQIPLTYGNIWLWTLDEKAIDTLVKVTNGKIELPGIKIIHEKQVSVKGE